jgi:copper transport protein
VLTRWSEFAALLMMLGSAACVLLVLRRVAKLPGLAPVAQRAVYGVWPLALGAAALSALTLLVRLWLQSVMLYGAEGAFESSALRDLIGGTVWGAGWRLQAIATLAYALGLLVARSPHGRRVGWIGAAAAALLLCAVPALSGHAAGEEGHTALAVVADWLHVTGAGVWLGTLAVLLLAGLPAATATPDAGATAFAAMVAAFSPLALLGAGTAGATGCVAALLHLHRASELWSTGYGVALLVKLGLLGVVAAIGFYNWRFVLPTLHSSASPARLRRTAAGELGMGVLVLLATAVLVALPTP